MIKYNLTLSRKVNINHKHVQVIKMYAWEKPFEQVVAMARKNEINCITSASYLRGVYLSFMVFTERLTLYITLLSYSLFGFQVTADIVSL